MMRVEIDVDEGSVQVLIAAMQKALAWQRTTRKAAAEPLTQAEEDMVEGILEAAMREYEIHKFGV